MRGLSFYKPPMSPSFNFKLLAKLFHNIKYKEIHISAEHGCV